MRLRRLNYNTACPPSTLTPPQRHSRLDSISNWPSFWRTQKAKYITLSCGSEKTNAFSAIEDMPPSPIRPNLPTKTTPLRLNGRQAPVIESAEKCANVWRGQRLKKWDSKTVRTINGREESRLQWMWLSCKFCQSKGQSLSLQPTVSGERGEKRRKEWKTQKGYEWENERRRLGFTRLRWKSSSTHITQSFTTICSHTCLLVYPWHTHVRTHKLYSPSPRGTLSRWPH